MATKSMSVIMNDSDEKRKVIKFMNSESDVLTSAYISKAALKKLGDPQAVEITIKPYTGE
jgi:hypothetical protein